MSNHAQVGVVTTFTSVHTHSGRSTHITWQRWRHCPVLKTRWASAYVTQCCVVCSRGRIQQLHVIVAKLMRWRWQCRHCTLSIVGRRGRGRRRNKVLPRWRPVEPDAHGRADANDVGICRRRELPSRLRLAESCHVTWSSQCVVGGKAYTLLIGTMMRLPGQATNVPIVLVMLLLLLPLGEGRLGRSDHEMTTVVRWRTEGPGCGVWRWSTCK